MKNKLQYQALFVAMFFLVFSLRTFAQEVKQYPTIGEVVRFDNRISELIDSDAEIELLASGFVWSEGPLWSYDGVISKVRFIPLYNHVVGNGHNATFTIARFVAVRIMYADLKSGNKRVVIQRIDDTSELAASIRLSH